MPFKIDNPEDLQPLNNNWPFPEIEERMELPVEKLFGVMDKHIKRVYKNGGVTELKEWRNEWEKKKGYAKELKEKPSLTNRTKQHLDECVEYFDLFLQRSYHLENDLIRSGMEDNNKIEMEEREKNRGNPKFRENKVVMPVGFYKDADKLKKENPDKSQSWIEDKLIRRHFDGDKSKKSTVYRRLKKHWQN